MRAFYCMNFQQRRDFVNLSWTFLNSSNLWIKWKLKIWCLGWNPICFKNLIDSTASTVKMAAKKSFTSYLWSKIDSFLWTLDTLLYEATLGRWTSADSLIWHSSWAFTLRVILCSSAHGLFEHQLTASRLALHKVFWIINEIFQTCLTLDMIIPASPVCPNQKYWENGLHKYWIYLY